MASPCFGQVFHFSVCKNSINACARNEGKTFPLSDRCKKKKII